MNQSKLMIILGALLFVVALAVVYTNKNLIIRQMGGEETISLPAPEMDSAFDLSETDDNFDDIVE